MFGLRISTLISKVALLFMLVGVGVGGVWAEPLFQFHNLTKKNGLSSSVVYDVVQDNDGFMWFATEDGLQKYDGNELKTYRQDRRNLTSLSNNIVRTLLLDKSGNLWVGTEKGVNVYQRDLDNFKHFNTELNSSPIDSDSPKLLSNQIRSMYQTSDGKIWIGSSEGLNVFDLQNNKIKSFPHLKVRSIFEDDHKQLWIGTLRGGIYLFDRVKERFINIQIRTLSGELKSSDYSIVDIYQDSFGRVLVATWGQGVYELNKETRTMTKLSLDLPSEFVRTIYQDNKGLFWIGTLQGLVLIEPTQKKVSRIFAHDRNKNSLITNNIFKIYQSDDETIWIGTYGGGVSRHYPYSRRFESYGIHPIENEGITDSSIFALSENDDGDIWVGSENGILSIFNPNTKNFKHLPIKVDGKKLSTGIVSIFQINERKVLVGTKSGLIKFDLKTSKSSTFSSQNNNFLAGDIEAVFIERDFKNRIWIGVEGRGVGVFSVDDYGMLSEIVESRITNIDPQSIVHLDDGTTYISTETKGIFKLETKGSFKNSTPKLLEEIPGTTGLSITKIGYDWKKRLWVATWSNGIKIVNESNKIVTIDEVNGLPNNSVYSLVADENSNSIWASTNLGIVAINADTMSVRHFRESDGLQGDEFNSPSLKASNGYLYFGGVNGFNRFYPNIVGHNYGVREPRVTEILVAGENANVVDNIPIKVTHTNLGDQQIELNFEQTTFSLLFTSPQYVRSEDLKFKYRLIGLSEKWIQVSKNIRQATYTNLEPGNYRFELQVGGVNDGWRKSQEPLNIKINPPWWGTMLAKFFYLLISVTLVSIFIYLFYQKRRREYLVQQSVKENEERLKLSLWGSGYEFWDWNLETGKISRSNEFKKIQIDCAHLSKDLHELASYVHPKDLQMVRDKLSDHINGSTDHFDICYRVVDASTGWRWIQDRGKVVALDDNGSALRMSGTQRDVTDIREKDAQFEMLGQAFKSTSDGVWIRDHEWRLVECNPAYERITGFSLSEKKGEALWFPEIQEQPENLIQRIRISIEEKGNWQGEAWAERKNNDPFPQKLSIDTLHDEKGNIRYYVGVFSDITFHKRTEEEFRKLANYDSLTGLPNRACLYDRLNQTIEKTKRDKGRFALFLVDVDNFKRINDSLGHNVGDHLIRQVASRLVNCNKEGDTVARIGGDEFVIVVENVRSSSTVATFSELLLKELNQPIFVKGQKLKLNFSIGITLAPDDAIIAERLMRNADTAMYEAKKTVENSYRFYSVEFNERARKRLALETALRKAIDDESIELFYQPKVDLNTGRVDGVEALARWTHKELGFISPAEFIPLAEETGLIIPLGHQLLRQAIQQTKEWVKCGVMRGRTSINLSAHQFWNRNLAAEASEILSQEGLEAKYIELEITESACMQDIEETKSQIDILKGLGFSLALDDFGTGYSSLAQLKSLPFDTLKVDKSFVDNIETNDQDAKVVKAIIDIAKTMDMEVVIEGVESKSQCEYLWINRAYIVQGFYFSRPVRSNLCDELFKRHWHKQEYLGISASNVTPLG